jgi:hypothetical protein
VLAAGDGAGHRLGQLLPGDEPGGHLVPQGGEAPSQLQEVALAFGRQVDGSSIGEEGGPTLEEAAGASRRHLLGEQGYPASRSETVERCEGVLRCHDRDHCMG